MTHIFQSFFANLYWIDVTSIIAVIALIAFQIVHASKKRVQANIAYNAELTAMRTAIYTDYEKNFFL